MTVFPLGRRGRPRKTGTAVSGPAGTTKKMTSVSFGVAELVALADYAAAGIVLLRVSRPHPVVTKLKAAMSRLKITIPKGL